MAREIRVFHLGDKRLRRTSELRVSLSADRPLTRHTQLLDFLSSKRFAQIRSVRAHGLGKTQKR